MSNAFFTHFDFSDRCLDIGSDFVINTCSRFCDSGLYGNIKYDYKENNYSMSFYEDNICSIPFSISFLSIECDTGLMGSFKVTCSDPVKVEKFNKFKVSSSSVCSLINTIDININTCGESCGVNFKIVENIQNVNGYNMQLYRDSNCSDRLDENQDFMCQPNKNIMVSENFSITCVSSSSSLAYSLLLLTIAALLNIFF